MVNGEWSHSIHHPPFTIHNSQFYGVSAVSHGAAAGRACMRR
jgi:hypothetical protein